MEDSTQHNNLTSKDILTIIEGEKKLGKVEILEHLKECLRRDGRQYIATRSVTELINELIIGVTK